MSKPKTRAYLKNFKHILLHIQHTIILHTTYESTLYTQFVPRQAAKHCIISNKFYTMPFFVVTSIKQAFTIQIQYYWHLIIYILRVKYYIWLSIYEIFSGNVYKQKTV